METQKEEFQEVELSIQSTDNLPEETKSEIIERLTQELKEEKSKVSALEIGLQKLSNDLKQNEESWSLEKESFEKYSIESFNKISELRVKTDKANKEKETMVMKYAIGEKEVILHKKAKEDLEKKFSSIFKEKEDLSAKVKQLSIERVKLQQICDSRFQEISVAKKELEIKKEEAKCSESKAVSSTAKLKIEVDHHKETKDQLDRTLKHLNETRKEIETTRKECHEFMNQYRDEEKNKKMAVQEASVKLMIDEAAAVELSSLKKKYSEMIESKDSLIKKIAALELEKSEKGFLVSNLEATNAEQKSEITRLISQAMELESLKLRFDEIVEELSICQTENSSLKSEMTEISDDMKKCRGKESELLEFTNKLTEKNVILQSDLSSLEANHSSLSSEYVELKTSVDVIKLTVDTLKKELEIEKRDRSNDVNTLATKLAESSNNCSIFKQKVIDYENEISVLKRKHSSKIKELTKEIQIFSKNGNRLEINEDVVSSKTSSSTSINKINENSTEISNGSHLSTRRPSITDSNHSPSVNSSSSANNLPDLSNVQIPDSHVLVEKIIKLQRDLQKKRDKQEFMEEHIETLQKEMKKKNKILQNYVLQQEHGALSSKDMDDNKRKMSQHGGIMASLYSSNISDSNMTLDLSLEINTKLQAVLEDTLLKNITLKENINTLGQEIASITRNKKN